MGKPSPFLLCYIFYTYTHNELLTRLLLKPPLKGVWTTAFGNPLRALWLLHHSYVTITEGQNVFVWCVKANTT